jgi:hypothetical protein
LSFLGGTLRKKKYEVPKNTVELFIKKKYEVPQAATGGDAASRPRSGLVAAPKK